MFIIIHNIRGLLSNGCNKCSRRGCWRLQRLHQRMGGLFIGIVNIVVVLSGLREGYYWEIEWSLYGFELLHDKCGYYIVIGVDSFQFLCYDYIHLSLVL